MMSEAGHSRRVGRAPPTSALHLQTDIVTVRRHVSNGQQRTICQLVDHLISADEQARWELNADAYRSLPIEHEFISSLLIERYFARLHASQHLVGHSGEVR